MSGEIVTLYESNRRDIPATLRVIADEIESGQYGEVITGALVLNGRTIEVFAFGAQSDAGDATLLLQAGNLKLVKAVLEGGA